MPYIEEKRKPHWHSLLMTWIPGIFSPTKRMWPKKKHCDLMGTNRNLLIADTSFTGLKDLKPTGQALFLYTFLISMPWSTFSSLLQFYLSITQHWLQSWKTGSLFSKWTQLFYVLIFETSLSNSKIIILV